jgi:hypothetical protein
MFDHRKSRAVTVQVLELAEGGVIDWESLARNCLAWMSEDEVREFARIHGYAEDTPE